MATKRQEVYNDTKACNYRTFIWTNNLSICL